MSKFYTPTKLSENIRETPEGFLLCLGVPIARTGFQIYGEGETPLKCGPDGTIKIYREAKEVFRPETIASFQGKSITIKHPEDFVAPENWQELTHGTLQNVRKGDELDEDGEKILVADLLITERLAIGLVKNGLREVSCGYEAEYEQTGEGEGRQFNIIGNHIALVEEGRAGTSYAINDHKGKANMSKLIERLKSKLGAKVVDEAMAEEKKEDKAKDGDGKASYDELVKMVKDLGEKIDGMGKAKDEESEDAEEGEEKPAKKEEKPAAKDEDKEEGEESKDEDESSLEDRLKALETAVAKLLEKGKSSDEDSEESEDDEEGEESKDDGEESESSMTGDTKSRAEILAPGIKAPKGTDIKVKALEAAYGTKEGKEVIDLFTGGKRPVFDSAEKVSHIFMAASEVLKAKRGTGLEKTKDSTRFETGDNQAEEMTVEKMNEINAAHWARK